MPARQLEPKSVLFALCAQSKGARPPLGPWPGVAFQASDALQKSLQLLENDNDVDEKPSVITTLRSPYSIVGAAVSQ